MSDFDSRAHSVASDSELVDVAVDFVFDKFKDICNAVGLTRGDLKSALSASYVEETIREGGWNGPSDLASSYLFVLAAHAAPGISDACRGVFLKSFLAGSNAERVEFVRSKTSCLPQAKTLQDVHDALYAELFYYSGSGGPSEVHKQLVAAARRRRVERRAKSAWIVGGTAVVIAAGLLIARRKRSE